MSNQVTVRLTLDWTFDERDWSSEKKHIEGMKSDPLIVFGYDLLSSLHNLNSLTTPDLQTVKIL